MLALAFGLESAPDLTLAKYSTLGAQGIRGVLEAHLGFLRLFARRPNTSLHLFYAYDPGLQDGGRMSVNLVVAQDDDQGVVDLGDVREIVLSSPIASFFDFRTRRARDGSELMRPGQLVDLIGPFERAGGRGLPARPMRFSHLAALSKGTKFMRTQDNATGYFTVSSYKPNASSRLYAMMRLMQNLDMPMVLRVDLYPTERALTLRDSLPLREIWRQASRSASVRDYALELVERNYVDLLNSLEGSPLFDLNAVSMSHDGEVARALLDAAASEAVETGSLDIAVYNGEFDALSLISPRVGDEVLSSEFGEKVAIPRCDAATGAPRSGFVQVPARARTYAHRDICNLFTLEEAACLFRLPALNEGEAVQLRKETAPRPVSGTDALLLGTDEFGQRAYFELAKLSKHAFVSGVPGSGKTNTMLHMATTLVNRGVPILVLEPAKHEYRALLNARLSQEVRVFSPGGELAFPLRVNPFQIPHGVTVGHHIGRLCAVFGASFPLVESLPFILDRSVEAVYAKHGWTPKDRSLPGDPRDWPTLSELYDQMRVEIDRESYSGEVRGNLNAALRMRIGALLRRELGELFDVPRSTFEPGEWLHMSAVVELEALGRSESNFLTLLLLLLVRESLMVDADYTGPLPVRHVIFIEEAHNLVAPKAEEVSGEDADPKLAATAFLSDMLREVRAYSEGIVVADQLPTAIAPEVLKNTGLKVALRMTSADDRQLLGSMMAASGVQLERMATADPGGALVLYEGLQRPFEIRMAEWLGTPGTPEYVAGREEREVAATSLPADRLAERLVDEGAPWYRSLRFQVPRNDADAMRAAIADIDRRFSGAFAALARLGRELPDAVGDKDVHQRFSREVDEAIHADLRTWPTAEDGTPLAPDLSPVMDALNAAKAAFNERARGWAGLRMGRFASSGAISPRDMFEEGIDAATVCAIWEYSDVTELYAERMLALTAGGMQRFGMTYARPGGAREFDELREAMRTYVGVACAALATINPKALEEGGE